MPMKRYLSSLITLFLMLFASGNILGAENELKYTISYENDSISLTTVERNGKPYSEIKMGCLYNSGSPGQPLFPNNILLFSVPVTATDFKLEFKVEDKEELILPYPPCPGQEHRDYFAGQNGSSDEEDYWFTRDVDLIAPKDYKKPPIANIDEDYLWAFNRILMVDMHPVYWTLEENKIEICRKIELKISWRTEERLLDEVFGPIPPRDIQLMIRLAKEKVVNPQDVEGNAPQWAKDALHKLVSQISISDYGAPYTIVTSDKLISSMERLAALRRLRGFDAEIVTIDSIINDPYNIGDFASGINDDAGKLRGYLRNGYYYNDTRHVLLAGSYPEIPGRWMRSAPIDSTEVYYISDQYYRDLNTQWPKATSSKPADISQVKTMEQNLNIGRISFSKSEEVDSYIDKLIQYEFNTNNSDLSYLDSAYVMLPNDERFVRAYRNYSDIILKSNYNTLVVDSIALNKFRTGKEAMEYMKKYNYGFMNWRGHGDYSGIIVWQDEKDKKQYGISALDSYKGILEEEEGNGLDNYLNYNKPSWCLSPSCSIAEIGVDRGTYTFADSYVLGNGYGGVALIGNSAEGLIDSGSELNQYIFNEGVKLAKSKTGLSFAGNVLKNGLTSYLQSAQDRYHPVASRFSKSVIGLTGDPLVPLWFGKPKESSKDGKFAPSHLVSTDSVMVATYNFISNKAQNKPDIVANHLASSETTNATKMVYTNNMLPYIHPCLISGLKLSENRYIFTDRVRFATDSKTGTAVTLINNSNLRIEAFGNVTMEGKFDINNGSCMTVLSYQTINVKNCNISSDGEMNLISKKEIILDRNTQISKGGKLTAGNL